MTAGPRPAGQARRGAFGGRRLEAVPLELIAGCGFIAIGLRTLAEHFRA